MWHAAFNVTEMTSHVLSASLQSETLHQHSYDIGPVLFVCKNIQNKIYAAFLLCLVDINRFTLSVEVGLLIEAVSRGKRY